MEADDLERQWRHLTGVAPHVASLLLEKGHLDAVVAAAREGEWFCAVAAVRELAGRGDQEAAWELLAPYVGTGWWYAVEEAVPLLAARGRLDEALHLVRGQAQGGERLALPVWARLLADHGQLDEAIALLRPRIDDWFMLESLVEVTEGQGRDEEVAGLLRPQADAALRSCEPWNALIQLARVLERAGRVDEAIGVLTVTVDAERYLNNNTLEELAELLARHDRLEDLRRFVAGRHGMAMVRPLADRLAERGDIDGAVEVLRPFVESMNPNAAGYLVEILARHGRMDEVMRVARPFMGWADRCLPTQVLHLLAEHGRAADGLALLDEAVPAANDPDVLESLFTDRMWMLSETGRAEEAIAAIQARPADWYRDSLLAAHLEGAGRIEEAIAVLTAPPHHPAPGDLPRLLILQDRVDEAIAACRTRRQGP